MDLSHLVEKTVRGLNVLAKDKNISLHTRIQDRTMTTRNTVDYSKLLVIWWTMPLNIHRMGVRL